MNDAPGPRALNYMQTPTGVRWRSVGLALRDFAAASEGLSAEALAQIARGFLISQSRFGVALPTKTMPGPLLPGATASFSVLPLCRRPGSELPFITIGRLDGNDVSIPDGSVSRLHALVVPMGDALGLFDAQSSNGTVLERRSLTPKLSGAKATPLESGDNIVFGAVRTTYLAADAMLRFVREQV